MPGMSIPRSVLLATRVVLSAAILLVCCGTSAGQSRRAARLLEKGIKSSDEGDIIGAVALFTQAIKADPGYYAAYVERGIAHYGLAEFAKAINDYNQAMSISVADPALFMNRANALSRSARYGEALADHRRAMAAGLVATDTLLYNMGNNFWRMGELDSALAYYARSLLLAPEFREVHANTAFVHMIQGRYDLAVIGYAKLVRAAPEVASYWNNLGYAELRMGSPDSAEVHIQHSLRLDPENEYAYRNRGLLYKSRNDHVKACADLELAIKYDFVKKWGHGDLKELLAYCGREP